MGEPMPDKPIKTDAKGRFVQGTGGRPKGATNKLNADIKNMVLQALEQAGGVGYLVDRAHDAKTAPAFLALVGKVLPMTVAGDPNSPHKVIFTWAKS